MVRAGDTRECPKCHRWIHIVVMGGTQLVWASHKPGRGKKKDCPTSAEPYKGA